MTACDQLPCPPRISTGNPIHLVTIHAADRRIFLTAPDEAKVLIVAWRASTAASGWLIGRYVIMPDQVHFFARRLPNGDRPDTFIRNWKKWTACLLSSFARIEPPVWQPGYVDRVLVSAEVYQEWREYVLANPVRAGHAPCARAWPYAGEFEILDG